MLHALRLLLLPLALLLAACLTTTPGVGGALPAAGASDRDLVNLATHVQQASHLARQVAPDVVLRQIDTDRTTTAFRFIDRAATQEITIRMASPDLPPDQWSTTVTAVSPLVGHPAPGLDVSHLQVGPERVATAILAHWPDCSIRSLTLYQTDTDLIWRIFCDTPDGVVSGRVTNRTGVFQADASPPARIPPTAPAYP